MPDAVVRVPVPALDEERRGHELLWKFSTAWQGAARNADGDVGPQMRHKVTADQVGVGNIAERKQRKPRAFDRAQGDDDDSALRNCDGTLIGLYGVHSF